MGKVFGKEMAEIGMRIRDARKMRGLTQTEFGKLIGKSLRAVQLYEKGQTDLSIGLLFDIAKCLEVDPTQLVGYQTPEVKTETLSDVLAILFRLYDLETLDYEIDVHRPPHDDTWMCGITFEGRSKAEHNADLCLALESFRDEIDDLKAGHHTRESFLKWQQTMLTYYSACFLK